MYDRYGFASINVPFYREFLIHLSSCVMDRIYSSRDEERILLVNSILKKYDYNSFSLEARTPSTKPKKYGLTGLFRYASKVDLLLMIAGSLAACVVGSAGPILGVVFGDMTNVFSRATIYGFSNTTNSSGNFEEHRTAATGTMSDDQRLPITDDEFYAKMNMFSTYYLLIGLAVLAAEYLEIYLFEVACERQIFKLRKRYFSQVLRQDVEWFDCQEHGDLSTKLSDDLERVKEGIGHKLAMVIQFMSTMICGVVIGLLANWRLTCVILAIAPLLVGSSAYVAKVVSGGAAREQLKYSMAGKVIDEVLTCIRTVTAFGGESLESMRYERAIMEGKRLAIKKYYGVGIGVGIVQVITYGSYAFAFWYSSTLIIEGSATVGNVFTVFFSVMAGALGVGPLLPYLNAVFIAMGSADVILNIIDRVPTIDPYTDDGIKPNSLEGKIQFKNVYFSYPTRPNYSVLNGLSITAEAGQTIAFIGSSGAGKSTIVNLLTRFYDVTSGQILIDGRDIRSINLKWLRENIGVVSQEPVLFGVSIAENIRYGRTGVTIDEIVQAATTANAHQFIAELPEGYDTKVGDRGTQLSGGQKQRIAIARALVRNPKILLLDEATSALDAKSESLVEEALIAARRGRTTIVIAHRLSTIKDSEVIVAMKKGEVVQSGSHDQLMAMKGLYYELVQMQKKEDTTATNNTTEASDNQQDLDKISLSSPRASMDQGPLDDLNPMDGVLLRLMKTNSPEWLLLTIGFISCIIQGIVIPVFAFFYAQVFATFQADKDELQKEIPFWASMFISLGVGGGIIYFSQIQAMSMAVEALVARMRICSFNNIITQQISWFDDEEHSSGKLQDMLAKDAPIVKSTSGLRLGQVAGAASTVITASSIALFYGWELACILMIIIPVLALAAYKQSSSIRKSQMINNKAMTESGKIASECVQNVKTVQLLTSQDIFIANYVRALDVPYQDNLKQAIWLAVTCAAAYSVPFVVYSAAFKLGSYLIITNVMTPSDVYRVFFCLSLSAASIGSTASYLHDAGRGKLAAQQIFQLIDAKSEADPTSDEGALNEVKGQIQFENVHFSYPTRPDVKILQGFTLTVNAGETVALVGGSGCGKSTVISLLERFYTANAGRIKLDGVDATKLNLAHMRRHMGIVSQEPVLFAGTIKYNIAYGALDHDVTDDEIFEAAKLANIHDFICSLPLGYDTPCGDRGTQLSGGQKQRIAIARALVRNPKILLLDEATSALDVESEKVVQKALDRARIGRTSLVVSHRLTTVQDADKIVVIQNGRVAGCGTHHELMSQKGFYYQLTQRQQM